MDIVAQHLLNGLMQGTMYGLVAMGFTLFFGVMNVIKFSHGDVLTFGAFGALVAAAVAQSFGLGVVMQLLAMLGAAILATAFVGAGIARLLVLPLRHSPALNMLLLTMMVGTVIRECLRLFFPNGSNPQRFPALLPPGGITFGKVFVRYDGLILLGVGFALIGFVHWVITRTRFGLAVRAVAEDEETARVMGMNYTRIVQLTFVLGSATGGVAGVIYGLYYSEINYGMGVLLAVIGFSAAIVGGLGNIWGAILGGFLFAGLQTLVVATIPGASEYKTFFAFLVVIMLITWRPTGLLAERGSERV
jgi:branched-chain amino acid transport system permease protein